MTETLSHTVTLRCNTGRENFVFGKGAYQLATGNISDVNSDDDIVHSLTKLNATVISQLMARSTVV
jgi:hypothetical protein